MSEQEPTRRELRAREVASGESQAMGASTPAPVPAPVSRRELREVERQQAFAAETAPDEYITPTGPIGLIPEPKSIVVEAPPSIENISISLGDTEVLVTGSIPLPVLPATPAPAGTGEIRLVTPAELVDAATAAERFDSEELGIAPVPAYVRSTGRRRNRVFATRLRAGRGQIYWVIGAMVVMACLASGLVMAWMLGLIK